jgi:hypothetical protein
MALPTSTINKMTNNIFFIVMVKIKNPVFWTGAILINNIIT